MISPLEPIGRSNTFMPDDADRAAHDVATAALAGTPAELADALTALESAEAERRAAGEAPSGLVPHGIHVAAATGRDAIAYRRAAEELLDRDDLDPALRRSLEIQVEDDPLRLASRRIFDARHARFARIFNAFASALGRSILTMTMAPLRVAQAAVGVIMTEHAQEPISLQERQALAHWKQYVELNPGSVESPRLLDRIDSLQRRWFKMKRKRTLRAAEEALGAGTADTALVLAHRALRYAPEDDDAVELYAKALEQAQHRHEEHRRSLGAPETLAPGELGEGARALAVALLLPDGRLEAVSEELLTSGRNPALADEAQFAHAIALGERGAEDEMWDELGELAEQDDGPLARYAERLVESEQHHPHRAFELARRDERMDKLKFVVFGPLAKGPRDRNLPTALEWLLEAPALASALAGMPQRLFKTATSAPDGREPARHAKRYLSLYPDGLHAAEMREFLIDLNEARGNPVGAHAVAKADPNADPEQVADLEQRAAEQALRYARKQERRDMRLALFKEVSSSYPETVAGRHAGMLLRSELEHGTTQQIRISRGFLLENPDVAGPEGLGLRPELLDDEVGNGELHPKGVTLLGGQRVEFALVGPNGDDDGLPATRRQSMSEERLARLVSKLEETSLRNALLDPLAAPDPDAPRDLFFERARL
ncbi:MAG: hypothetical protein QNK03_01155, partial [Myxococcota bacterium]|nr:hypothetical protein [Myxococcota bacterium]